MSKEEIYQEPIDEPVKKRKWSFWGYGLLFFTVFYIALMFILEAAIQPRESMTATIVAYIIGIIGLAIFAGLVRDKSRVLISIPILLIVVFGTGYLFNYVAKAPVYNPLAPVSERTGTLLDTMSVLNDTELIAGGLPEEFNLETIEFWSQFAFVIDLIIALPLFIFGTLALTWFTQIFTQLPNIWTIFSVLFALIFFLIGLIITPFLHLLFSSFLILGSDLLPGALYVMEGISIFQGDFTSMSQAEIDEAIAAFYNASFYFNQAAMNLEGLQKAGIIGFAQMIPVLGTIVSNLYWFSLSALHLSSGLGPFANGTFFIMNGLQDAMDAMNISGSPMPLSVEDRGTVKKAPGINDTLFEDAIEVVNDGLLILGDSTEYIEQALEDLKHVSLEDVINNITRIPGIPAEAVEPIMESMSMVEDYLGMFEGGVTVISALLDKPEISPGVESEYATLTHFLYGAYNLFKAGDNIADLTAFNGTSENFEYSYGNFSIVQDQLHKPEIQAVATSDTPFLNETVLFVVDMVDIGVPLCNLGYTLATSFLDMDGILTVFDGQDYEDISNYPALLNTLNNLRTTTSILATSAAQVDANITAVELKALTNTYGVLNDIALTFTSQLADFGFTQYVTNANSIANSFYYMFMGIMELSFVAGNITAGQAYFLVPDYVEANNSFANAQMSLTASITYLNQSIPYMDDAVNIGGMTQLQTTLDAITVIRDSLLGIQGNLDTIVVLMADPVTNSAAITTLLSNMLSDLADINTELQGVTAQ